MKISKHTIVDITMSGDQHAQLVAMLHDLRRMQGDPHNGASQYQKDEVEVMIDRMESF